MKKILVTLFAVFTFTALTVAQNTTFEKGTSVVSAGVGIGSNYYGLGYSTVVPQVFASYEYGIMDNLFSNGKGAIGVGGINRVHQCSMEICRCILQHQLPDICDPRRFAL